MQREEPQIDNRLRAYKHFCIADRACRNESVRDARAFLLRRLCLIAMGESREADRDLLRAAHLDISDCFVQDALLQHAEDQGLREVAASELVNNPRAPHQSQVRAQEYLLGKNGISARLTNNARPTVSIQVLSRSCLVSAQLSTTTAKKTISFHQHSITSVVPNPFLSDMTFDLHESYAASLLLETEDGSVEQIHIAPVAPTPIPKLSVVEPTISVIIPIYSNISVTRQCFEALARQTCLLPMQVIVIDDASPDSLLSRYAINFCVEQEWTYFSNTVNSGFASSVNRGISESRGAFLLILNADAILPQGAVDRMLMSGGHPNIGTVVPLSNDGGFSSFPRMLTLNSLPSTEQATEYDAAAARANTGQIVDIPSGTAFCMLITRPCLDRVGPFSVSYGRGYFEDVDFCLRAHQQGFRNVLAADVFVTHVGGQSFGQKRLALTARNARIIRDRFPEYEASSAAFMKVDPLRIIRSRMERVLSMPKAHRLLLGNRARIGPALDRFLRRSTFIAERTVEISWNGTGDISLNASDGYLPQSVVFKRQEIDLCTRFITSLRADSVEIFEPDTVPAHLIDALVSTDIPINIHIADRQAAHFVRKPAGSRWLSTVASVRATNRLAQSFLESSEQSASQDGRPRGQNTWSREGMRQHHNPCVGVFLPAATIGTDRLLQAMVRTKPAGFRLVGLGSGLFELKMTRPESILITGAMSLDEYPDAIRRHRISHFLLPYRGQHFDVLEIIRAVEKKPAAFFDWTYGHFEAPSHDLLLDVDQSDMEAARAIWFWMTDHSRDTALRRD